MVGVVLIPVLPSAINMRLIVKFVADLLIKVEVRHRPVKVAVIGDRMLANFKLFVALENFLENINTPFLAKLRASQKYVQADSSGLGVFDMSLSLVR